MVTVVNFLIAGATGRQSGAVVSALLTHSDFKIEPKRAIFEQLRSHILPQIAVFLAQAHGPTELSDAKGFIDAAAAHGAAYFVYSSVDRDGRKLSDADPSYCKSYSDKFYIEQYLKSVAAWKGTDDTIIRPTWFADNTHWGFPGKLCMTGLKVWMNGKSMQVVTTTDIGKWAVEGLVRPDKTGIRNEALPVASEKLSFQEIDLIFKRRTGKGVPVTFDWFTILMIWLVKDLDTMFRFIESLQTCLG
ncbi:hypothetical protein BGZ57DRAFT_1018277 [Hyaloscypha finlandica]|nr:hypothetical protein BGZ57DRAFT_1018277 [Hyaloscypha finlandica]